MNEWITEKINLRYLGYKGDPYYFEHLCGVVSKFLNKCPVPIISNWNKESQSIFLFIGKNKVRVPIDESIHYRDYIAIIEQWAKSFYPKIENNVSIQRNPSKGELANMVATGNISSTDILGGKVIKIEESFHETILIERIYLLDDQFRCTVEEQKESNTVKRKEIRQTTVPLNEFLRNIRQMLKQRLPQEARSYFFHYSVVVTNLDKEKLIEIDYPPNQLGSFFRIHSKTIVEPIRKKSKDGKQVELFWGPFHITTATEQLFNEIVTKNNLKYEVI